MRTIEFRLFDTTSKKMYYMPNIGEYTIEQVFRFAETDDPYTKVMQFTGLLDKNGTKIFEGDKVKSKPRGAKMYGDFNVIYDKSYCSFVCHHIEWCDFTINPHENYPLGECRFDIEIIGNIHEAK